MKSAKNSSIVIVVLLVWLYLFMIIIIWMYNKLFINIGFDLN